MIACFITGTDTGVGKTWLTLGLMTALKGTGLQVAGMKPVASGAAMTKDGLRNDDAMNILAHCSDEILYEDVNPYCFRSPIAPHIAAKEDGATIEIATIEQAFERLSGQADAIIVEGIGGWRVPIANGLQTADLVRRLQIPVVLVVGLRLGCISHALLSAEAIGHDKINMLGWAGSQIDPDYKKIRTTIDYLSRSIQAPLLGVVPHLSGAGSDEIASYLDIHAVKELDL